MFMQHIIPEFLDLCLHFIIILQQFIHAYIHSSIHNGIYIHACVHTYIHTYIQAYILGWFKNKKVKLDTKTPPNFFTLVICIIVIKFQLPTPTGRQCSMTSTYSIVVVKWKHRPNVLQIVITLATFLCNYAV